MEIQVWDVFKAIGLNEVSKRVSGVRRRRGGPGHSSIGEKSAEEAKRVVCGVREAGRRVSLGPKEESVSRKREWSAVPAVERLSKLRAEN